MLENQALEDSPEARGPRKKWGFISILIIVVSFIGLIISFKFYQEQQSRQAQLHFAKAEELYDSKKYQEAVTEYEFVASKHPRSAYVPACLYKSGYIYFRHLRKDDLSAKAFEALLAKYPDNQFVYESLYCLLDVYDRLGKNQELVRNAQTLLAKYPTQVSRDSLRIIMVTALMKLGNIDQAYQVLSQIEDKNAPIVKNSQEYYQIMATKDPSNPQLHYELARIYKGMGLTQKVYQEVSEADRIKKMNQEAIKREAAEQAYAKKMQNMPGNKPPVLKPKLKISQHEEQLYISHARALSRLMQETDGYTKKLGEPKNPEEQRVINGKLEEFVKIFWVDWYRQNNTTLAEFNKMMKKINTDRDLAQVLSNKIYSSGK